MSDVIVEPSPILGIPVITQRTFPKDARGMFAIPVERPTIAPPCAALGFPLGCITQMNLSESRRQFTVRGLHVSNTGKLVFAIGRNAFTNVVVNLTNPDCSSFGTIETFLLAAGTTLYIPPGFGNGVQNHTKGALYGYLLDAEFDPLAERTVNVAEFDIPWREPPNRMFMSAKDVQGMRLPEYAAERRRILARG